MGYKKVLAYMEGREIVDREEVITVFGNDYVVPSYDKLKRSYIASKISQAMAKARNDEGHRFILAKRGRGGVQYVNVPICKNSFDLWHIKKRIRKDILGHRTSLKTVSIRLGDIDGLPGGDDAA